MTPLAISLLDEAIVFMKGEEKWPVVMDLLNKDIDLKTQPAQVLKKLPKLTIFTDYQNK
jgi:6-phosphogluconolactonase/glucosamine-6-phosphate isomerase/deaminase